MRTRRIGTGAATLALLALAGCAASPGPSHYLNPLGWPSKLLDNAGRFAADSGLPLVRETGRLLMATGELVDAPALFVEGVVTIDVAKLDSSLQRTLTGTGGVITAGYNLPCFVMPGWNLDLGRDADLVNDALEFLENSPPEAFRLDADDDRTFVFPRGTRVRASGGNLIYAVPGRGDVIQAAESSVAFDLLNAIAGMSFPAQERSWGFVVRDKDTWDATPAYDRVRTILHEFYHQEMQIRQWLQGWSVAYWPAYNATFVFTGHQDHWAEGSGRHGAGAVDRGLMRWAVQYWRRDPNRGAP